MWYPPTIFGIGSSWEMTLILVLFLMGLTLHPQLTVQIDSRNLSLLASWWKRGCAGLILYLTGCTGHMAFALHYCCWQNRAKKMDELFVGLPPIHFALSHPGPFSSLHPSLQTCFSRSFSPGRIVLKCQKWHLKFLYMRRFPSRLL